MTGGKPMEKLASDWSFAVRPAKSAAVSRTLTVVKSITGTVQA